MSNQMHAALISSQRCRPHKSCAQSQSLAGAVYLVCAAALALQPAFCTWGCASAAASQTSTGVLVFDMCPPTSLFDSKSRVAQNMRFWPTIEFTHHKSSGPPSSITQKLIMCWPQSPPPPQAWSVKSHPFSRQISATSTTVAAAQIHICDSCGLHLFCFRVQKRDEVLSHGSKTFLDGCDE